MKRARSAKKELQHSLAFARSRKTILGCEFKRLLSGGQQTGGDTRGEKQRQQRQELSHLHIRGHHCRRRRRSVTSSMTCPLIAKASE
jgi:hypothetical protein